MIFKTINQLEYAIIFLFSGILIGLFNLIFSLFTSKKPVKLFEKITKNTIFYAIFAVFFEILIFFYNFGKFSITLLISYFVGFLWSKFLTRNLVVILKKKCYNALHNKIKRKALENEESKKN